MIAPGSYFGIDKTKGYVRITCSGTMDELGQLMNRIEKRLALVRLKRHEQLKQQINEQVAILEK